ncbi:MAG: GNAT family N-acetyltransferase, partial [Paracoccaceae bacterium]
SPDHPAPELAHHGAIPLFSPTTFAILDLRLPKDRLRSRLHQKWRNRLCHAESQDVNVSIQTMPCAHDHWLYKKEREQRQFKGYRAWPIALTRTYAQVNPGSALLFTAQVSNHPVAAMLVLLHGTTATYQIGVNTPMGRQMSAHNLLMWRVIHYLKERGFSHLDLGIIDTEYSAGLARFKLGTGAHCHETGGIWGGWPPLGRSLRPLAGLDRALMTPRFAGHFAPSDII